MQAVPQRVLHVVAGLALLPPGQRPMGLLFEDAEGSAFPHEAGEWVAAVRQVSISLEASSDACMHTHDENLCPGPWCLVIMCYLHLGS